MTAKATPKPDTEKKAKGYFVKEGCSITTKVGILTGDKPDEVKPEFLQGGLTTIQALVESGHLVEK